MIDGAIHYHFVCRGFEHSFAMIRDVVKAEAGIMLTDYITALFWPREEDGPKD